MRRIGMWMACGALMTLGFGCDDGRGSDDAGGIVLMDSGSRDAGARVDAGRRDAGGGGSCSISSFMPLPAACLPRCANATIGELNACFAMDATTDAVIACRDAALQGDPTPSTSVTTPGTPLTLDCELCFNWQIETAVAEACPSQYQALVTCFQTDAGPTGNCDSQGAALDTCLGASTTFDALANMRAGACFSTTAFFPGLSTRLLPMPAPSQFSAYPNRF